MKRTRPLARSRRASCCAAAESPLHRTRRTTSLRTNVTDEHGTCAMLTRGLPRSTADDHDVVAKPRERPHHAPPIGSRACAVSIRSSCPGTVDGRSRRCTTTPGRKRGSAPACRRCGCTISSTPSVGVCAPRASRSRTDKIDSVTGRVASPRTTRRRSCKACWRRPTACATRGRAKLPHS